MAVITDFQTPYNEMGRGIAAGLQNAGQAIASMPALKMQMDEYLEKINAAKTSKEAFASLKADTIALLKDEYKDKPAGWRDNLIKVIKQAPDMESMQTIMQNLAEVHTANQAIQDKKAQIPVMDPIPQMLVWKDYGKKYASDQGARLSKWDTDQKNGRLQTLISGIMSEAQKNKQTPTSDQVYQQVLKTDPTLNEKETREAIDRAFMSLKDQRELAIKQQEANTNADREQRQAQTGNETPYLKAQEAMAKADSQIKDLMGMQLSAVKDYKAQLLFEERFKQMDADTQALVSRAQLRYKQAETAAQVINAAKEKQQPISFEDAMRVADDINDNKPDSPLTKQYREWLGMASPGNNVINPPSRGNEPDTNKSSGY